MPIVCRTGRYGDAVGVHTEISDAIWTVVIDRPGRRNAVDGETAAALADAFRRFDADADAAVAVLAGAGGTFCAGADLQALSKPVIAAIEGHAVAGGIELAAWCDLRVMASDATVGVFCRRWGVPLIDGGTVRLPRIVGLGRALDWILTGRAVDAAEAQAAGFASRVVPPGRARAAAEELAREIAAFPQACVRSDRHSVYAGLGRDERDALGVEFAAGLPTVRAEGVAGAARFAGGAGRHGSF